MIVLIKVPAVMSSLANARWLGYIDYEKTIPAYEVPSTGFAEFRRMMNRTGNKFRISEEDHYLFFRFQITRGCERLASNER